MIHSGTHPGDPIVYIYFWLKVSFPFLVDYRDAFGLRKSGEDDIEVQ